MITIAVTLVGRVITIWEAIKKRSHEPIYINDTKYEWQQSWKSNKFMWNMNKSLIIQKCKNRYSNFVGTNNIYINYMIKEMPKSRDRRGCVEG